MDGPGHYREAEDALDLIARGAATGEKDRAAVIAIAQAHALLALVAAIVDQPGVAFSKDHHEQWREAVS